MFIKILTTVGFLLTTHLFAANEHLEIKPICKDAHISSFKVSGTYYAGYIWKTENMCLKTSRIPSFRVKDFPETLRQLKEANLEAAKAYGISPEKLFKTPVKIFFNGGARGPALSLTYQKDNTIYLGVFTEWVKGINKAAYIHELNHLLVGFEKPPLPKTYKKLQEYISLKEVFSDLLALTTTNTMITPVKSWTQCLNQIRDIPPGTSFNNQTSHFFQADRNKYYLLKCCNEFMDKPATREDEIKRDYCNDLKTNSYFTNMPVKDMSPLSLDKYPSHINSPSYWSYEKHLLAMPTVSMFREMESKVGYMILPKFIEHLKKLETLGQANNTYKCNFKNNPKLKSNQKYNHQTKIPKLEMIIRSFVQSVQKNSKKSLKNIIDKYGLKFIFKAAKNESLELAIEEAYNKIVYNFVMNDDTKQLSNEAKECYDVFLEDGARKWANPKHKCFISCKPI